MHFSRSLLRALPGYLSGEDGSIVVRATPVANATMTKAIVQQFVADLGDETLRQLPVRADFVPAEFDFGAL